MGEGWSRKALAVVLAVVALIVVWVLLPSEEDRIRRRIGDAARALEEERAAAALDLFDPAVFQSAWDLDGEQVLEAVEEFLALCEGIEVDLEKPRVELEKGKRRARVTLRFAVTGRCEEQFGYLAGSTDDKALARVVMEKGPDHGWRIVEVTAAMLPGMI